MGTTIDIDCAVHGNVQLAVLSKICSGYICLECVKEHLFIEDIELEIYNLYPELMKEVE